MLIGWALHDPDQTQRQLNRLTTTTLLIGIAVLIPAAALYGFLTWWFTHFAVTDSELRIRTGLLFRRTAHIRLERIQAIDVTQPLLARVAGVAKLRLDVIGTDKKDELAFLGAGEARALRAELLARAAGFAPETAHEVGEAPARQMLRVPAGVLAVSLLLTGATWGWLLVAGVVVPLLWMATHSLWTVLAVAVPMLGAAGASSVGRFVTEYDWTLAESPDGLRIDHGLLDRAHETVPPGRVQTVRLVEPLLWRRRGWVRVELDVAGSSNSLLLPVAPRELAESVVARVLPGVTVPRARRSSRRRAARGGASRCGGGATDSPSPTRCSPPGTACCAAACPWCRTPRCRACGWSRAPGSARGASRTSTWTPGRTIRWRPVSVTPRRRPPSSTPRRNAPAPAAGTPSRTAGCPDPAGRAAERRRGRQRNAGGSVPRNADGPRAVCAGPVGMVGMVGVRRPRCAARRRRCVPSRRGPSGR
ncbi:hypothetical protein SHKM778_04950 [Streptomyces sp. KM77-8]|uniref:YdbS-like PH domain-containing protein n=1 Tax=Streptomyces haneummycinicus TaxID=3074435 RepID=A0AAT9H9P3_9ACTN